MITQREAIDPNKSATALRALKVLEALAQARGALSAAEVAGIIGAERSTAYRMLMTLMEAGYVVRDQRARAYRLGYKVLTLSRALLSGNEKTELVAACLRESRHAPARPRTTRCWSEIARCWCNAPWAPSL